MATESTSRDTCISVIRAVLYTNDIFSLLGSRFHCSIFYQESERTHETVEYSINGIARVPRHCDGSTPLLVHRHFLPRTMYYVPKVRLAKRDTDG
jgi:hypothetical protein